VYVYGHTTHTWLHIYSRARVDNTLYTITSYYNIDYCVVSIYSILQYTYMYAELAGLDEA
jgi:hypothetical protein